MLTSRYNINYDDISDSYINWYVSPFFIEEDKQLSKIIWYKGDCNILDIGCGAWLFVDMFKDVINKDRYFWIDISKNLIELARNVNEWYRFECCSVLWSNIYKDLNIWLSVWLYWVMNYLTDKEIDKIISISDKFFLMDYKNNYHPVCYDPQVYPKRQFDQHRYAKYNKWSFNNYDIYTNMDIDLGNNMDFDSFIYNQKWIFAKTYASFAPHEYIMVDKNKQWWLRIYESFFNEINRIWYDFMFTGRAYKCVNIGRHQYWLTWTKIDHTIDSLIILNRAIIWESI